MYIYIYIYLCFPLQYTLSPSSRFGLKLPSSVTRHISGTSDHISRYPVPNRKNLPFDIVELMEEVEQKVWVYFYHKVR